MKMLDKPIVEEQHKLSHATSELTALLLTIKLSAKIIRRGISKAEPVDILGASGAENAQGGVQQKLDSFTNEKSKVILKAHDIVADIASEEEDEIIIFEDCEYTRYVVLIGPLGGLPNIDVNASAGTIFSIYRRVTPADMPVTEEDFLQPGNKQVAVDYVVYSSSTMLVYATGYDVHAFTHDSSLGVFCLCQERMRFPRRGKTYSINKGSYIRSPNGVKKRIKFYQEEDKSTSRPYTSRYVGSLVADFHRNLLKGGIHLYPSTTGRLGGKLHLLYECNPMAFLAGRAGGKASDGKERTLDIIPETPHQRRSFFVGDDHMTEGAERFIRKFLDV